ncbi:AMSH-like ubiquitin thioesterase 2 isoform X2 [Arachis ipaensis]|uniref:AMSH-like ubiquitin thioesterase 2 isoform X2 n=1 Tax=Arachis ipaensis TaxID=130454 RepID=UPI000A2B0A28|nr:AMSH-like ubiquitin thioesterase 2 isoform X2 [Arachis ipaensis]
MLKDSSEDQELSNMKVRNYDAAESVAQSLRNSHEESAKVSSFPLDLGSGLCPVDSLEPTSIKEAGNFFLVHKVTQSSPSPAMCFVAKVPQDEQESHIVAFSSEDGSRKLDDESTSSRTIGVRDVHISMRLMEDFLHLAKENTEKDVETCGILGAVHENGTLYMTTLIIPKQESASNSCQATNEEEVFKILNERSLYPVGWIHMMIPEAFAIVLAPTDTSRSCGLFRLTDPEGMNILKNCMDKGFHPHKDPDNGNPLYEHCSNVYKNSNLRFEIFDLR